MGWGFNSVPQCYFEIIKWIHLIPLCDCTWVLFQIKGTFHLVILKAFHPFSEMFGNCLTSYKTTKLKDKNKIIGREWVTFKMIALVIHKLVAIFLINKLSLFSYFKVMFPLCESCYKAIVKKSYPNMTYVSCMKLLATLSRPWNCPLLSRHWMKLIKI